MGPNFVIVGDIVRNFSITLFYWIVATLPALPFPVLYLAYRRILRAKRLTVQQVLGRPEIRDLYLRSFPIAEPLAEGHAEKPETKKPDTIVATFLDLYYHWAGYALGIALNALITIAITVCVLTRQQVPLGLAAGLAPLAMKVLPTVVFGFAGAYVWTLYDLIRRYQAVDLTPSAFYFSWLRLLVGCIVGPLVAAAAAEGLRNAVAFGVGILPIPTIAQYFKNLTERLGIGTNVSRAPAQEPTLHKLQGMTTDVIERMAEEKIDSAQALGYSDPFRLFLRTDIEWPVILDLIDQAFLFVYVEDRLASLRPLGQRGCVDLSYLFERCNSEKLGQDERDEAKAVFARLPGVLAMHKDEVVGLCRALFDDPRVTFLRHLYYQSFSTVEERPERAKATA